MARLVAPCVMQCTSFRISVLDGIFLTRTQNAMPMAPRRDRGSDRTFHITDNMSGHVDVPCVVRADRHRAPAGRQMSKCPSRVPHPQTRSEARRRPAHRARAQRRPRDRIRRQTQRGENLRFRFEPTAQLGTVPLPPHHVADAPSLGP